MFALQTADPTFTMHVVDVEGTNMRVELCIFDVPGDLYCRESSLSLVRSSDRAHPLHVATTLWMAAHARSARMQLRSAWCLT